MKPLTQSRTVIGGIVGLIVVWAINHGWLHLNEQDAKALVDGIEIMLLMLLRVGVRNDTKAANGG